MTKAAKTKPRAKTTQPEIRDETEAETIVVRLATWFSRIQRCKFVITRAVSDTV
jgi:hypothetical protein